MAIIAFKLVCDVLFWYFPAIKTCLGMTFYCRRAWCLQSQSFFGDTERRTSRTLATVSKTNFITRLLITLLNVYRAGSLVEAKFLRFNLKQDWRVFPTNYRHTASRTSEEASTRGKTFLMNETSWEILLLLLFFEDEHQHTGIAWSANNWTQKWIHLTIYLVISFYCSLYVKRFFMLRLKGIPLYLNKVKATFSDDSLNCLLNFNWKCGRFFAIKNNFKVPAEINFALSFLQKYVHKPANKFMHRN